LSTASSSQTSRKIGRPSDRAKREAILDAATKSFFDHGFAATSIEQVAGAAGVSKVTIYNHFGDKRGLFTASVERECEKMRGYFRIGETPEGPIRRRLAEIGEAIVAFLSRPEMIQFERRIAAETVSDPAIGQAFLDAGPRRIKEAFGAFLEHAAAANELQIDDAELAAEQFVCLCKGMGDLYRRFGVVQPENVDAKRIERAVDMFLAAYAPARQDLRGRY
jgi:TetR/AcrR family transcriptional repressor of mexJK operon